MRAFFGGQINKENRGNLALVVETSEDSNSCYSPFLYPVDSEEFAHLTGVRAAKKMPERVYIGVSQRAGSEACRQASCTHQTRDLRSLDLFLVNSYFLDKNREKPSRIVLEETETGYKVVEGQ